MPLPTEGIYFSQSFPAAPPGNQVCQPQTDGETPEQSVTFYPQQAVAPSTGNAGLLGVVKPDGTSITMDPDGTIHAPGVGGGTGGTGGTGGGSASGGLYVCVEPTPDPTDGTRTQWILPAPLLAGTVPFVFRNGPILKQLGQRAQFTIQGTQLTLKDPLEPNGWLEVYYIQGTPNSQQGGGGSVNPSTGIVIRGSGQITGTSSVTMPFPAGTQAGDLAVLAVQGITVSLSGWTNLTGTGSFSFMWTKTLTSGDISAGGVTCSGSGSACLQIVTIAGGTTSGVRECEGGSGTSGFPRGGYPTSSAVQAGDVALLFGATFSPVGGTLVLSATPGTLLQSISNSTAVGIIADAVCAASVNTFTLTDAGSTGSSTGGGAAVVVIKQ